MPSPFPGMDPYIEQAQLWRDFHNRLAAEFSIQLNQAMPSHYAARLEPHIEVGVMGLGKKNFVPDVAVTEGPQVPAAGAAVAIAEAPFTTENLEVEQMKTLAVHVTNVPEDRLVTVIEILSPINKRKGNDAHDEYLRKRQTFLESAVHLLEIDLLREGARIEVRDRPPKAPYYIYLSRAHSRRCEIWPLPLHAALPTVPVPLLPGDPDTPLDLQQAVSNVYVQGRYGNSIDYTRLPPGPLTEAEAAWIAELLGHPQKA